MLGAGQRVEHVGLAVAIKIPEANILHRHERIGEDGGWPAAALQIDDMARIVLVQNVRLAVIVDVGKTQIADEVVRDVEELPGIRSRARIELGIASRHDDVGAPVAIEVAGAKLARIVGLEMIARGMKMQRSCPP